MRHDSYTVGFDAGDRRMIGVAQAGSIVGLVLIEAVVLYVGYGYLEERVAPSVLGKLEEV